MQIKRNFYNRTAKRYAGSTGEESTRTVILNDAEEGRNSIGNTGVLIMKKRVICFFTVLVILVIAIVSAISVFKKSDTVALYEGKWKVTKQLTEGEGYRARLTFFSHHYLGRTVILGDTFVEISIFEWPYDLEWTKKSYDFSELVWISKNDPWILGNVSGEFEKFIESEEIQFIRYLNEGVSGDVYCGANFIVLDDMHLAYSFMGSYYLLEPFQCCDSQASSKDLIGTWEIAYLDSYEDSYEGGFEEIEELKGYGRAMREVMATLKGTDFKAEEWLGKTVDISEDMISISESSFQINQMEDSRISRENFEKEMGIHDGLSIYDDMINVCNIKCYGGEDIICVIVDKNNVIMHIEEGWFMLNRQ